MVVFLKVDRPVICSPMLFFFVNCRKTVLRDPSTCLSALVLRKQQERKDLVLILRYILTCVNICSHML